MLELLPLLYTICGLVLYTVLAGADFGAGIWQLSARGGGSSRRIRELAHHVNAPVWEANHVWLIFVLVVLWTAYPVFFGSVASTMFVPLGLALVGIVFRGLAYTLQNATTGTDRRRVIDNVFAVTCLLAPFMLTTVLGALASDRVPVGNAAGDPLTTWLNPTSMLCGLLGLGVSAYLAAVYLAADARRLGSKDLRLAFRRRAIGSGVVTGALSLLGLPVLAHDAPRTYTGLTSGWGLLALVLTVVGGAMSMILVAVGSFQRARLAAAAAVAMLLLGWAVAQRPYLLPGLTVEQAAADPSTLIALTVAVVLGGAILAPSLALLFHLTLTGRLDDHDPAPPLTAPALPGPALPGLGRTGTANRARAALVFLLLAVLLLAFVDGPVAHAVGVLALAAAGLLGFVAADPARLASGP
jgi:cytochrome d ubiquinol oxidase subunit II